MTVRQIIRQKSSGLYSAREDEDFLTVSDRLTQNNVGVLVVLDDSGRLTGILSERDLVRSYAHHKGRVDTLSAADMMTRKVYVCSPDDNEIQIMTYMLQKRIRHMPVVEHDKVLGVVSLADSVRHRLIKINLLFDELEKETDQEKRIGIFTQHLKGRTEPKLY